MEKSHRLPSEAVLSDGAIIARVRAGDTQLYEILIRRYNQRLYRIARAHLREEADVEDVLQETYLRAYSALSQFQGRSLFSTWLTRILINCARERLRSYARRPALALDTLDERDAAEVDSRNHGYEPEHRLMRAEIGRLIERAVETLPVRYRTVFVMLDVEHSSVAETAECLGITRVNVKVRHYRARRLLRESLCRMLPEDTIYGFAGEACDRVTRSVMAVILRQSERDSPRSALYPAG